MKTIYITEEGRKELERRIRAKRVQIEEIQKEKAVAYEVSGDGWHDNPGFNQLTQKEEQAVNELRSMERHIATVTVLTINERNTEKVDIGSVVKLRTSPAGQSVYTEMILEICGNGESDGKRGRVSYDSPLGKTLMGMVPGEKRIAVIPKGKTEVEVLELLPERGMPSAI